MCFELHPAHPDDAPALTAIAFAAKRHWGYPESWIAQWTHLLTVDLALIASQPTFVARSADAPVGFASLRPDNNTAWLEHLWVLPPFMRCGIGRALFEHSERHARLAGFTSLRIESDPHAEAFYRRMGATRVGGIAAAMDGQPRVLPLLEKRLR